MTGRIAVLLAAALMVAGCVPSGTATAPQQAALPVTTTGSQLTPSQAARNFVTVVERVEPLAEQMCREHGRAKNCDFRIVIDDRPNQPANAFQMLDDNGQPILGFTLALIADARNPDEIAFVLGHEASHHILGHIPATQRSAMSGAILGGILAAASGGDQAAIEAGQQMGATLGARGYSKDYELQADALGAEIAIRAGYDAVKGAAFFDRLPDPGNKFLGSHPATAQRKAVVRRVQARLLGSAAGY